MAGAASEVYEPLNQYKPVARNIGIVDGPFEYLTTAGVRLPLPFTTRMTVVRLGNGDLFIHSPIAFEPALADRLQAMGTVRHLVSPNQFHYAHIGEWSRAFPGTIAWASPRARKRARSRGIDVRFDRDISVEPPEEWRAEIDQTAVPGGIFGEIIFFHKESKTLILADTIINLELDKIRQPWRFAAKLTGMYYPRGQIFFGMRLPLLLQKQKTRAAVQKMLHGSQNASFLATGAGSTRTPVRLCNALSDGRSSPLRFARMRMSNLVTRPNFRSGSKCDLAGRAALGAKRTSVNRPMSAKWAEVMWKRQHFRV
jgi:hypothetical protein